jgi:pimeloyl-ACP methyl ester carboxylesterase
MVRRKETLSDGLVIAWEEGGAREGPPLLLLHNACSTFRATWGRVAEPLAARFYLIGPDLRGHGESANPTGRLDLREMADDMAWLLDRLGIPSVHLMAFSGGASTALYLVTRHPARVRSMVLIGSHYTVRNLRTRGDGFWDPERIRREQPAWWAAMVRWHGSEERVRALLRGWQEEDRWRPDFRPEDLQAIRVPHPVADRRKRLHHAHRADDGDGPLDPSGSPGGFPGGRPRPDPGAPRGLPGDGARLLGHAGDPEGIGAPPSVRRIAETGRRELRQAASGLSRGTEKPMS